MDSQPWVYGHLAKTQALMGKHRTGGNGRDGSQYWLRQWRQNSRDHQELKKWKEAQIKLLLATKQPVADKDWEAAKNRFGLNQEELEQWARNQNTPAPGVWLFDEQDLQDFQRQGQAFQDPGPAPAAEQEAEESESVPEWL